MFYRPDKRDHGLPRDPFKSLVVPRPIGWISTINAMGRPNLAPYSFFNAVCEQPPCVAFGTALRPAERQRKDSQSNAEVTGEFVVNLATYDQREAVNETARPLPAGESEFASAGLEMLPSRLVRPPRVKGARAHLECVFVKTVDLPSLGAGQENFLVIGKVVGIHIDDDLIVGGLVDITRARPIARLGYMDYSVVERVFQLLRPTK